MSSNPDLLRDVFAPGSQPDITYNPRISVNLESDLEYHLQQPSPFILITGPSKSGKTVLVNRIVTNAIKLHGSDIGDMEKFWSLIRQHLGLGDSYTREHMSSEGDSGSLKSGIGFMGLNLGGQYSSEASRSETFSSSASATSDYVVRKALLQSPRPIVVDDFHFIHNVLQKEIIRAIKPLVYASVPVILVSISDREEEFVSKVPDMAGRLATLRIPKWSIDELMTIGSQGFKALKCEYDEKGILSFLAHEAYGNPFLMQGFCYDLCWHNGIREVTDRRRRLQEPSDWRKLFSMRFTEDAKMYFRRLLSGPAQRGKKRNIYLLNTGEELDVYQVIIRALARTGPLREISVDTLLNESNALLRDKDKGVQKVQLVNALQNMAKLAASPHSSYAVNEADVDPIILEPCVEYDKELKVFRILDPNFALFLRWTVDFPLNGVERPSLSAG